MIIYFISKFVIWLFELGEIDYAVRAFLAFLSGFEILFSLTAIANTDTKKNKGGKNGKK